MWTNDYGYTVWHCCNGCQQEMYCCVLRLFDRDIHYCRECMRVDEMLSRQIADIDYQVMWGDGQLNTGELNDGRNQKAG